MAPDPDQVYVHHRVAAHLVREKVHPEIAVEQQHREGGRENRKGGDDQQTGSERRPAEDRHAHVDHARSAQLEDRRDEVDARQERADPGDLQRPQVIIDADPRRIVEFRQGWVRQPAGAGKLADDKRCVDQQHSGCRQPKTYRVQDRERYVAHAELQWHDEVYQADDKRHRHEEDHDRAMRRENLVVVLRRQIPPRVARRERQLRAHHDRVGKAADQHDQPEHEVHDADPLVVDAGQPLAPQIGPPALPGDQGQNGQNHDNHQQRRAHRDGLVKRDRGPGQLAQHVSSPNAAK